jgi:hypothetical protein
MPRYSLCLLLLVAACRGAVPSPPPIVVDFIKEFDRAERRPPDGYALIDRRLQGTRYPSIAGPAPGRIIWQLPLPRRGIFHAAVAIDAPAAVRFRVGVSDDRIYEELASVVVTAAGAWSDLRADLSAYAGWKWSLFYRPERLRWRVVLSADAIGGVPARVMWGAPSIAADAASAREYVERRARLQQ